MNPDPPSNVFAAAVQWLEGVLLGSVATIIAVLAVACLGLLLMSGRIDLRRAVQVIFGCFVLFGASSIARGIIAAISGDTGVPAISAMAPPTPVYANMQSAPTVRSSW